MKCRQCNSTNTHVTCTRHKGNETWRYCCCFDCDARYKTIETYSILKCGAIPGVKPHRNCFLRGEQNSSAVLTEANVLEIRRCALENEKRASIAKRFGIHVNTVYRIVKRELWSHV